jgi:purine-nucleoside phosphorylase
MRVDELAGFPRPSVEGHPGLVRSVEVDGARVLVALGRAHLYEGNGAGAVVHGVRTAVLAGCRTVVLTNAAGGVDPSFAAGQAVLVADHLNLTGQNPLAGPPPPPGDGPRFVDLTDLYAPGLRALARQVDPGLPEAVYAAFLGPSFETPAEIRMARTLGAGLVGMSTALEAIAVRQLGGEVLGVSLVTNPAAGVVAAPIEHGDVLAVGEAASDRLGALLAGVVRKVLAKDETPGRLRS